MFKDAGKGLLALPPKLGGLVMLVTILLAELSTIKGD